MSALTPKADIRGCDRNVRFVPIADIAGTLSDALSRYEFSKTSCRVLSLERRRSSPRPTLFSLRECDLAHTRTAKHTEY